MKKKLNLKVLIILLVPLLLAGCGNTDSSNQTMDMFNKQNEKAQKQFGGQQNVVNKVSMYQGTPIVSGNLVTVPMIIQNDGQNPINYISNNVSLQVSVKKTEKEKKMFKTETKVITNDYVVTNNDPATYPSNFNLNLQNKDMLQTFMTFKLNSKQMKQFTKSELSKAYLVYKDPTGKKVKAKDIPSNTTASDMQENLTSVQPTKLSKYYENVAELMVNAAKQDQQESIDAQEAKQQNQSSVSSSSSSSQSTDSNSSSDSPDDLMKNPMTKNARSLMSSMANDNYNDSHYTDLKFKVIRLDSHHLLLDFDNETSEDFVLPLNSFELTSNDQENIMVKPSLNNYSIYIPSNKETEVVIPMSQNVGRGDYLPELRDTSDNGNRFNSTKHMINQIIYEGEE